MSEVRLRIRRGEYLVGREPYASAAVTLLRESGCVVVRWRNNSTGVAYTARDDWEIETPEPRGPVSYATLAHEVAHQELHRPDRRVRKVERWRQELEAWLWALDTFRRFDLPGIESARADATACMGYAIQKAARRVRDPKKCHALIDRYLAAAPEWILDARVPVP